MAYNWGSLQWGGLGAFAPSIRNEAGGLENERANILGNLNNPQGAQFLQSLGYTGNVADASDLGTWLRNSGYSMGVGHIPGTSPGGRAEFYGLLGPNGQYVSGQPDPYMGVSDTLGEQIAPFAMLMPALSGIIGAAGAGAASGEAGYATLGSGDYGVSALGPSWSPEGLGLTGMSTPNYGLSELGQLAGGAGGASTFPTLGGGGMAGESGLGGLMSPGDLGLTSSSPTAGLGDFSASVPGPVSGGGNWLSNLTSGQGGGSDWTRLLQSYLNYNQNSNLIKAGQGADPFAQYRPMYGAMLAQLMQNPSSVTSLPGYQAALGAGEQSLTRNLASQGLTGSGTAAQAITNFGGQFQNQFYQQMLQTLGGFSGANINNANLMLAALASGRSGQNQAISSGLGGLMGLFGGGGGGSMFDSFSNLFDEGSLFGGIGDSIVDLFGI